MVKLWHMWSGVLTEMASPAIVYALAFALVLLAIGLSPVALRADTHAAAVLAGATIADAAAPRGVVVTSLRTGGVAARAGLRTGDAIVAIDRQPVRSRHDAARVLRRRRGRTVVVDVARRGHRSRLRLTLGEGTMHGA